MGENITHSRPPSRSSPRRFYERDARARRRPQQQRTEPQRERSGRPPPQPLPAVSAVSGSGRGLHGPAWINSRGFYAHWRSRNGAIESREEPGPSAFASACVVMYSPICLTQVNASLSPADPPPPTPPAPLRLLLGETFSPILPVKCSRRRAGRALRKADFRP